MQDEIIEVYEREIEIKLLIDKLKTFSFKDLIKIDYFYHSVYQKNTSVENLERRFTEFFRINLIQKRKHKNGKISHDFYYSLDDGTYLLYSIALEEKPVLINAFHVNRNFKKFRKKLLKAYKNKITG